MQEWLRAPEVKGDIPRTEMAILKAEKKLKNRAPWLDPISAEQSEAETGEYRRNK
jgi:hypothetical protein